MNLRKRCIGLVIFLMIPWVSPQAQPTIAPDRPGLGNGTHVVYPSITYLETGVEYYEGGAVDQFSFGQVLFRHGLSKGMEFRLLLNSFILETRPVNNETGAADPGVGLKFNIYDNPLSRIKLSGLGSVSIPAGYSPFTDNKWHPSASLLADYKITPYWIVTSNAGFTYGPDESRNIVMVSVTPTYSVPSTEWGGYAGYAGYFSGSYNQHFLEAGVTRIVLDRLQFDVNGGVETKAGDLFVGVGFAFLF